MIISVQGTWKDSSHSGSMCQLITSDYIPFREKPWQSRLPIITSGYQNKEKDLTLDTCIQSLLEKAGDKKVIKVTKIPQSPLLDPKA